MKPEVLRKVQQHGWDIEAVERDTCVVKCPTQGCKMRARFDLSGNIPQRDVEAFSWDQTARSFDDARLILRERRQELGLTIAEIEHISGIAGDHLAKFERVEWQRFPRLPNISTFIDWANSIGIDVVLRMGELPPVTLRWIADTRDKNDARQRRFQIERGRDRYRRATDPLIEQRERLERQQQYIAEQMEEIDAEIAKKAQGDLFADEW